MLFYSAARHTRLTAAYSGRLARGIPNRLSELVEASGTIEPYPYQAYLLKPVAQATRAAGRIDLASVWAGQGAPLLRHHHAPELYAALVSEAERLI